MFVLGIQGSPRKNGNADFLLTSFLKACEDFGARTEVIRPEDLDIQPCKELIVCEKKGFCPLKDQMETGGYRKVKQADVVVLASPVFFYNVTAQVKVFIDRCQMFWGRKYKLKLKDPHAHYRQGFLLSVAASRGKRLFEGVELTAKYFFDAISADYAGSLTYKQVEDAGDIIVRPELEKEIQDAVAHLLSPLRDNKRVIFVSQKGCRSLMASAFAKEDFKGRINVLAARLAPRLAPGLEPVEKPDALMLRAMAQIDLDLKYQSALVLDDLLVNEGLNGQRDQVVFLGSDQEMKQIPPLPGEIRSRTLTIPLPGKGDLESYELLRNEISRQVNWLLPTL